MSDLEIGRSAVHELGVFARRRFAAGDLVHALDDSRVVDATHPLLPGERAHHCDYLAGGRIVLMREPERYINSSCEPSTVVRTTRSVRRVMALRVIEVGDEITYDYLLNCHDGVRWTCACGAASCRREVPGSFFDLPRGEQVRLRPLLDTWFVGEHRARLDALDAAGPAGTWVEQHRSAT